MDQTKNHQTMVFDYKQTCDDILKNNFDPSVYSFENLQNIIFYFFRNVELFDNNFDLISHILLSILQKNLELHVTLLIYTLKISLDILQIDDKKKLILNLFTELQYDAKSILFKIIDMYDDNDKNNDYIFLTWIIDQYMENIFNINYEKWFMYQSVLYKILESKCAIYIPKRLLKIICEKYPLDLLKRPCENFQNVSQLQKIHYMNENTKVIIYNILLDIHQHDILLIKFVSNYKYIPMYNYMLDSESIGLHARVLGLMHEINPNLDIGLPRPYFHYGQLFYSMGRFNLRTLYQRYKTRKIRDYQWLTNDQLFNLGTTHRDRDHDNNYDGYTNIITKGYFLKDKIVIDIFKNHILLFLNKRMYES